MISVQKLIFVGAFLAGSYYVNTTYLKPFEQRVDKVVKAAEAAGMTEEPVDVEKVCGFHEPGMTMEQIEKINACYQAEMGKGIKQINAMLKAADMPTLGGDEPCAPPPLSSLDDNQVATKFMELLRVGNPSAANELLSRDLRSRVSTEDTTAFIDKQFWRGKTILGATSFGQSSVTGNYVCDGKTLVPAGSYEFTLNNEITVKAVIETIEEDGAWKIRSIKPVGDASAQTAP
jgi:hypothetical protein